MMTWKWLLRRPGGEGDCSELRALARSKASEWNSVFPWVMRALGREGLDTVAGAGAPDKDNVRK